jgi:alkanesulfonate monooxygenase SsuD/methylene tetrahydromethanopterin reductase-like flavin-dependent oxidoreductase (luciferase family)
VQKPHPPLWIGGPPAKRIIERTAKFGDVWHPGALPLDKLKEGSDRINALAGRPVKIGIRFIGTCSQSKQELLDKLGPYAEFGCHEAVLEFRSDQQSETIRMAETAIDLAGDLRR